MKKPGKKFWIPVGITAGVLVIGGLTVFGVSRLRKNTTEKEAVSELQEVALQDFSDSITLSGKAAGISKTNVTSKAASEVTTVSVSVGDTVTEGDVLFLMDTRQIEEEIATVTEDINRANALEEIQKNQNVQALQDAEVSRNEAVTEAQKSINEAAQDLAKVNQSLQETDAKRQAAIAERDQALAVMNQAKAAYDNYVVTQPSVETPPETGDESEDAAALAAAQAAAQAQLEAQNAEKARLLSVYQAAADDYAEKKAAAESLEEAIKAASDSVEAQRRAVESAQTAYQSTVRSADKSVSAAQEAIDISGYQKKDTTLTDRLADLQAQLAGCTVLAPVSGVVTAVNYSVGDKNTPDSTMVSIEDTTGMVLRVSVTEDQILSLQVGQRAEVTANALGDEVIEGKVTRVVRVKDASTNADSETAGNYAAEVTVGQSDLLIGMTAKAKILLTEKAGVLAVPSEVVQDDGEQTFVYVAVPTAEDPEHYTAEKRVITVGDESGYFMEVTGGELKAGDLLVMNQMYQFEGASFRGDRFTDHVSEDK